MKRVCCLPHRVVAVVEAPTRECLSRGENIPQDPIMEKHLVITSFAKLLKWIKSIFELGKFRLDYKGQEIGGDGYLDSFRMGLGTVH